MKVKYEDGSENDVNPSINEVLEGLMEWYARQIEGILGETTDKN